MLVHCWEAEWVHHSDGPMMTSRADAASAMYLCALADTPPPPPPGPNLNLVAGVSVPTVPVERTPAPGGPRTPVCGSGDGGCDQLRVVGTVGHQSNHGCAGHQVPEHSSGTAGIGVAESLHVQ